MDDSHDRLLSALAGNSVDVAIMTGPATAWDDRMLPLWNERVIVAFPGNHPLANNSRIRWADLVHERFLVPQQGPGRELEGLLATKLRPAAGCQKIIHQDSSLDRLLTLVSANYGTLLIYDGATGVRHELVIYKEVWEDDGPTNTSFMAYWREATSNPALGSFLAMLRERYHDFAAQPNAA